MAIEPADPKSVSVKVARVSDFLATAKIRVSTRPTAAPSLTVKKPE
jgi:hypothetical protein